VPRKPPFGQLTQPAVWTHPVPTLAEVLDLPVSVPFAHAARAMGYKKDEAYRLIKAGQWPGDVPLRQIGHGRRCLRADLLAHLKIDDRSGDRAPAAAEAVSR
jgi:hypothetical protein